MPPTQLLRKKLDQIHAVNDEASAKSLREFLERVVADVVPQPQKFGLVAEQWQRDRHERVLPAAEYIAGLNPDYTGKMFYFENWHKGCFKSGSIALIACWLLAYSKRPLRIYVAAKDVSQANVIADVMKKTADLNVWLKKHLIFKRNRVDGKDTGSILEILTSDAGGVQGITADVLIIEELSHWSDRLLWDSLFGGAIKRSGRDQNGNTKGYCLVYTITNAGFKNTWQHDLFLEAQREDSIWSCFQGTPHKIYPSWMSQSTIDSVRRSMSPFEARRLIDNEWIAEEEGANRFFAPEDIDACIGTPKQPPPNAKVFLGIDYAEKKDRTAMSTVWMDENNVVHVSEICVWQGSPIEPTKLEDVEHYINLQLGRYRRCIPVIDPFQTLWLMQKYDKVGQEYRRFEARGGKANLLLGDNLRTLMKNRKIVYSPFIGLIGGSTFIDELHAVIAREKSYGVRIDHKRNSFDDRVTSVGMSALCCVQESEPATAMQKVEDKKSFEELALEYMRKPKTGPMDRTNAESRGLFGMDSSYGVVSENLYKGN